MWRRLNNGRYRVELSAEAWRCLGRLSSDDFRLVESAAWSLADLSDTAAVAFSGGQPTSEKELFHDVGRFRLCYEVDRYQRVVRLNDVTELAQAEDAQLPPPAGRNRPQSEET